MKRLLDFLIMSSIVAEESAPKVPLIPNYTMFYWNEDSRNISYNTNIYAQKCKLASSESAVKILSPWFKT